MIPVKLYLPDGRLKKINLSPGQLACILSDFPIFGIKEVFYKINGQAYSRRAPKPLPRVEVPWYIDNTGVKRIGINIKASLSGFQFFPNNNLRFGSNIPVQFRSSKIYNIPKTSLP